MSDISYNKNSPQAVIRLLYAMAYADKNISEEEVQIISKVAKDFEINSNQAKSIIDDIKSNDLLKIFKDTIKLIDDPELRNKILSLLSELATSDHILHENELYFLQIVAEKWGMFVPSLKSINE